MEEVGFRTCWLGRATTGFHEGFTLTEVPSAKRRTFRRRYAVSNTPGIEVGLLVISTVATSVVAVNVQLDRDFGFSYIPNSDDLTWTGILQATMSETLS